MEGGASGITDGPLFRTTVRKTKALTNRPMTAIDICRMMKRRLKEAGPTTHYSPHSLRVAVIINLSGQEISLEEVQALARHADPRTARLYDRRQKGISRNLVERITV